MASPGHNELTDVLCTMSNKMTVCTNQQPVNLTTWPRHGMETISALLAHSQGRILPVTKGPVMWNCGDISVNAIKLWNVELTVFWDIMPLMLSQCNILLHPHCWKSLTVAWAQNDEFHDNSRGYEMFTIDVHYYVVTTTVSYQVQNFRQGSSSLYKWTQYPRFESVLGLLHLYQHHFPWSRSDISGIDILSGPPHPVWLCTSDVLLPEYPHYCRCCMNTSGWTL